jgi:hypothetical protein
MKFTRRTRACALSGLLALLCADSSVVAKHDRVRAPPQLQEATERVPVTSPSAGVLIKRVNFFLDQDAQTKEEEAQKKHKAEQQHRTATARPKPNPKAASAAAASIARPAASQPQASSSSAAATRTDHGVQSAASEPLPSQGGASATPASSTVSSPTVATAPAPASSHDGNQRTSPARLTREQLIPLMRGATILRTSTSGALRQWVNGPDGTLTVYWAGGGFIQPHSASGKWSVTEDGHFCLQIDWPEMPENWCRFLERTANGAYQPIPDSADATWTPPKDKTEWRPMTIRR